MQYSNRNLKIKTNIFFLFYLLLFFLVANYFFNYVPFKEKMGTFSSLVYIANFGFLFIGKNKIPYLKSNKKIIISMMMFFCISSLSCYIYRGQGTYATFRALLPYLSIPSLYFVLHKFPISKTSLIKIFIYLALLYVGICIYQQFFAGSYLFGARPGSEIRMGLNRYCISGDRLCFIPLFYFFYRWSVTKNTINLIWCSIFLLGIFFQLERMLLFGVLFGVVYFLVINKKLSISQWIIIGLLFWGLLSFLTNESLEGNFLENMESNTEKGEDDIRIMSILYYINEFQVGLGTVLFGNGIEFGKSSYGQMIERAQDLGFYRVDIGIFGEFNTFGLLYVIFMLYVLVYFCIFKRKSISPIYTSIFAIMLSSYVLNGTVDMPYRLMLWPILLYLIDMEEYEKKEALTNHRINS